jgi:hypothetical protein
VKETTAKARFERSVIPSRVENGAVGEAATWTEGHWLSEREASESNPVVLPYGNATGSFDSWSLP